MRGPFNGCIMLGKIANRFKVAILFLSFAPVAGGFWLVADFSCVDSYRKRLYLMFPFDRF